MKRAERLNLLLDILAEDGHIDVDDIVTRLGVSPATARRDLDTLAEQRLLTRTRGGAMAQSITYDLPIRYKSHQHADQKELIARAASELVPTGAVIGLTGGTTTTAIATMLAARPDIQRDSDVENLTVVTNSVNIAALLATRPQIKVVVVGGVLNPRSYELVGGFAEQVLSAVNMDIAFVGVNALDAHWGASTHNSDEAAINRLMVHRARRAVVVADSSKIGKRAFAVVGDSSTLETVVTDAAVSEAQHTALREAGYRVVIAE